MSSIHQVYYPPLLEGCFYHIYNRGNNGDNLFYRAENYSYFLRKLDQYMGEYVHVYAYCLLPNHFRLLIQVVDFETLPVYLQTLQHGNKVIDLPEAVVSEQFRRFFSAYTKAIKVTGRANGEPI